MDHQPADSMGNRPASRELSASSLPNLGLEAKRVADEIVRRAILRLSSEYGEPYGMDDALWKQKIHEWTQVLYGFPAERVDAAGSDWILGNSKWPKASELRSLCHANAPADRSRHHRAETPSNKSPASCERVARIKAIQERHTVSVKDGVNWGAVLADPEYQQIYAEYLADGGRPVGAAA